MKNCRSKCVWWNTEYDVVSQLNFGIVCVCGRWKGYITKKKEDKIALKKDDDELVEKLKNDVVAATARIDRAKSDEDKLKAVRALEDAKAAVKNVSY